MGGASCAIPHLSIVNPNVIPTDPAKVPAFDAQLRKACAQTDIVKGLVDAELTDKVCAILQKPSWVDEDRRKLKAMLDSLYS
jgi:hypothetical protein